MFFGIRWNSLRTKIIAWSFVPAAIILGAVALVGFYAYNRVTGDLVIQKNQEVARLSASQLARELDEYTGVLEALARLPDVYGGVPATQRAALKAASNRLVVFDAGVVLLDNHGTATAAEPERPDILGQDWSARPYFRQMARTPGSLFSDVVGDGPGGAAVIVVAVPMMGSQGEFRGLAAGMFRVGVTTVSAFYGSIVKLRLGGGETAYLVDHNGQVIYHADADRIGEDFSGLDAVREVTNGRTGALRTRDVAGRDIVASYAPAPGTPWGLVTEVEWGKLLAGSEAYRRFLFLLLALGVLIPAAVVAVASRRITQPITDLIGAAQEVAGGKFGQTLQATTGDELEELIRQFNRMSAQLSRSYTELQAREERLALVLQGTNDGIWDWDIRTGDTYFSPRWKSMLGYEDHEIANRFEVWQQLTHPDDVPHTLDTVQAYLRGRTPIYQLEHRLRHKDGSYRWILARGIVLRDAAGQPYRMAGSHTDITERKQADEALQRRLNFEQLITGISTDFINLAPDAIGAGIHRALQAIGEFAGVDRSYVFLFSEDGATLRDTHEWCADGIRPCASALKDVAVGALPWLMERLRRFEAVHVPRVASLPPEAAVEQRQFQTAGICSLVNVPMTYRGALVGFVGFDAVRAEMAWPEDDIALLRIVGEIFANALEHQRAQAALQMAYQTLERRVEERTAQLTTLNAMAERRRAVAEGLRGILTVLNSRQSLDETLDYIANQSCRLLGSDAASIFRLQDLEGVLAIQASCGLDPDYVAALRIPAGLCAAGQALATRQPVAVPDTRSSQIIYDQGGRLPTEAECGQLQRLVESFRAVLTVPLVVKDAGYGAIAFYYREPRVFSEEETQLALGIGNQAALAIESARLREQAEATAALAERSRLARDLHDSVTQLLYSVTLYAEAAARLLTTGETTRAAEHLRSLRDTSQDALREMRLLIFELRPPALEKTGLAEVLRARLKAVEGRGGMVADLRVEGTENLPLAVQQELYQIAQEALNNVLRHAHAQHVSVSLAFGADFARLEVADDGVGFDPVSAAEAGGQGLRGLRERAQRLGAKLEVASEAGKGTRVRVAWGNCEELGGTLRNCEGTWGNLGNIGGARCRGSIRVGRRRRFRSCTVTRS
ncbi:MAG: PAS domain-containing protein [Chloroflexi bacterium]|nr:PAS domain-containing protein [Chloroflexota bacterium]